MKLLKNPSQRLLRQFRVRIKSGPCEGMFWSLPTRSRFIRGVYEPAFAGFVAAALKPDDVFWDVGAHFGYYTLLAAHIVQRGACYAFEPNSANRWYLEHHVRWNRLANVTVLPCAVAAANATRGFGGSGSGGGKLDAGNVLVQTRSIDSLVESQACRRPTFMKIDVEGAELEVLGGKIIEAGVELLCVATHGAEIHSMCRDRLADWRYETHDSMENSVIIAAKAPRSIPKEAWKIVPRSQRGSANQRAGLPTLKA